MSKGILTKREKEVFSLLIENKTTREIANILSISEKTVRNHISGDEWAQSRVFHSPGYSQISRRT